MSEVENIPKHWQVKKLGEIGEIVSGGTPSTKVTEYWNGNISWISPADLSGYKEKIILKGRKSISDSGLKNSSSRLMPKGSVLFSSRAPIGYVVIAGNEVCTNQGFKSIIPNKSIFSDYLFYFLKASKQEAEKVASGTTFKEISLKAFSQLEIPVPPFSEQEAIVSKIEELLSDLDNGKQQLQIAQQQLKVYRQSLLKWAFEGKLTNKIVNEGEVPKGWKQVKIEDIATVGTGATPLKGNREYYEDGKIAWVTSGSLNDEYVKEATEYVTDVALKETNLSIYPKNTLLLAMYGEGKTRGKCSELQIEACTNQAIAAIHFKNHDSRVKPFLKYFLLKNYNDIRRLSSGGVQPNLNLGIVKRTLFPFPPFEEQQLIVSELESKLTVCDKIEETISQSLLQAETLRQSILKKAFEGKLV